MHILYAEVNEKLQRDVASHLQDAGQHVHFAKGPVEDIVERLRSAEEPTIQVLILGSLGGTQRGLELLKQLRGDARFDALAVVFYTYDYTLEDAVTRHGGTFVGRKSAIPGLRRALKALQPA